LGFSVGVVFAGEAVRVRADVVSGSAGVVPVLACRAAAGVPVVLAPAALLVVSVALGGAVVAGPLPVAPHPVANADAEHAITAMETTFRVGVGICVALPDDEQSS
jgi:hypothetical protein